MLVSTFELLVKPISIPGFGPQPASRLVAQGYFLTIANTSNSPVRVRLQFTATTPGLTIADTIIFSDVINDSDLPGEIAPVNDKRSLYVLNIPANDTALVTLLPDLTKPEILTDKSLEIRGYVEVFLAAPAQKNIDLLLTPEHRGTFLPDDITITTPDFDQLAYALPTANGGSLFTLTKAEPEAAQSATLSVAGKV
jgi:hypothetical protein